MSSVHHRRAPLLGEVDGLLYDLRCVANGTGAVDVIMRELDSILKKRLRSDATRSGDILITSPQESCGRIRRQSHQYTSTQVHTDLQARVTL